MTNLAYDTDPRIQGQLKKEEEERQAIKQAKKDARANYYKEIEEKK